MKWKVEEYQNNVSDPGVRIVDEAGKVIVDNEPYYPQALDPQHAHLIAAAPAMVGVLREVQQQCLFDEGNGDIGVSEDVVIPSDMFDRICDALNTAFPVQP